MIYTKKATVTKNETTQMYTVRSLDLMNWLCQKGFRVKKVLDADYNPRFKIFLYEDTPLIRQSVSVYLSQSQRGV